MMENFNKIVILVATHKPDKVYQDDIYTPIHVGRAVSKYKDEMAEIIGDDTGDNISEKNPFYCELTACYWAWKNLKNIEYVGLCHYRRYFEERITIKNIDRLLNSNYDIILPSAIHLPATLFYKFKGLTDEDRVIFFKVMEEFYPEYYETAVDYIMNGNKDYAFNMFFCSWKIFSQMMEFVFGFLSCTEKYVKLQPYTNGRRIFGYFSEYLIPIFCLKHRLRIKEMPIISMLQSEKPNYLVRKKNVFKRIINSFRAFIFSPLKYKRFPIAETMLRSLICDGILDHDGRLIK